jgi:hypothetical protein
MTDREQRHTIVERRTGFVRPVCVLLAFCACLLVLPVATAGADVMKKYRTAYANKLDSYRNRMDAENTFYNAWKVSVESHAQQMALALADPQAQDEIPKMEAMATLERSLLQEDVTKSRDKIYANVAAFKAKAVDWFKTKADKNRFKARLAIMKSGFSEIVSADADLMGALLDISTAQVGAAQDKVMKSGLTSLTAEDLFAKGLKQLHALE